MIKRSLFQPLSARIDISTKAPTMNENEFEGKSAKDLLGKGMSLLATKTKQNSHCVDIDLDKEEKSEVITDIATGVNAVANIVEDGKLDTNDIFHLLNAALKII